MFKRQGNYLGLAMFSSQNQSSNQYKKEKPESAIQYSGFSVNSFFYCFAELELRLPNYLTITEFL